MAMKVAIVAHDAGGAEILSSYVRIKQLDCLYVLEGPALKIFNRKLNNIQTFPLENAIQQSDYILCGTSQESNLEFNAIKLSRALGKRCITFLDHWIRYESRFQRNGEMYLPDEVWVGDTSAEKMAKEIFPNTEIKLVANPYFVDLKNELDSLNQHIIPPVLGIKILYVCEPTVPIFDKLKSPGYTDHEALQYFFKCIENSEEQIASVCLRPHPIETNDKYSWAIKDGNKNVTLGGHRNLLEEIVDSDWVVGRCSMALVVGLLAEKKVFSCIPPGGKPCALPYKEIMPLNV